ncbi:alkaline phosphatase family protein [Demequina sp. NBRC 110057]|uniref:alkaline phosphatase family protein n=1 Tax=Demequina sp. NBRC 110057 TaxID=1570346 RepID=UPI000A00A2E7|nr:nucleotide pyrophosphatase/phosphodiesterase family protein [Demequina sp. NBRC 110057]
MNLPERLAAAGLTLPDYGRRDLGAVLSGAFAAVGAADAVVGRDARADQARLGLGARSHVVVVLLDGLGALQLGEFGGHAPFLRSIARKGLSAGYPSTTASSLAFLGTGRPAGQTGMAGYTVRNPRTGGLANLVSWDGAYDAHEWQPYPSLLEAASAQGVAVTAIGKARFEGSGLTQAALRGGTFVGAEGLDARVDAALAAARRPGVTYLYWAEIDKAGHHHGWGSDAWVAQLEDADRALRRLASSLPRGAALVATADHGMVNVTGAERWDVAEDAALREGVALVAGEPRAMHLHVESPAAASDVAARWSERLGSAAVVATREEAREHRLFGVLDASVEDRIGDVVVAMAGRASVVDSRTQTKASLSLVGMHGSLTPAELRIPLLVAEAAA